MNCEELATLDGLLANQQIRFGLRDRHGGGRRADEQQQLSWRSSGWWGRSNMMIAGLCSSCCAAAPTRSPFAELGGI
jgi:hypothetical protein